MPDKKIESLVKLRDSLTMAADALDDYINSMAPKDAKEKPIIPEEKLSILNFEAFQTPQLGSYEIAFKTNNPRENWDNAFAALNEANATIKTRYHGQNYGYSYWLYQEGKIYRCALIKCDFRETPDGCPDDETNPEVKAH